MASNLRMKALATALCMAVVACASAAAPGDVTVAGATVLEQGDAVAGPLQLSQSMSVVVALKLRNKPDLDAQIRMPGFEPMSGAQFAARYSPTHAQAQAVADFLERAGFTNIRIAPNRLLVSGDAPAANVQRAFQTLLVKVKTHDGRIAFANSQAAKVPGSLQPIVRSLFGLENVHLAHRMNMRADAAQSALGDSLTAGTRVSHSPLDFPSIYSAGGIATGSTIPVGVIADGSMASTQSDFPLFLSQNHLPSIPLNIVEVNGGGGSDTSGDTEWSIDTQALVGMSGGVEAVYMYNIPSLSTEDLLAGFNQAVTDNIVRIVNVSIGGCETASGSTSGGMAAGDDIFAQAVAQGQTFTISAGDRGANECGRRAGSGASWPANSQYVVAVSGTSLYTTGNTTWANEQVWSGTGGSPSMLEPQPTWQMNVGQNAGNQFRGLGDIALDADPSSGMTIIVHGKSQSGWGGTSLASPLFAGLWARALATRPSLGFAGTLIYANAIGNYASDYHDVTSGSNGGQTAAAGWDYPTGFGSFNVANFVSHVASGGSGNQPPAANFSVKQQGLFVRFTDTSTDSDGTIASRLWDFGDGSSSTSSPQLHRYASAGTYMVKLTVTDNDGAIGIASQQVTVDKGG